MSSFVEISLLNVPALNGMGKTISPVRTTRSGFSAVSIAATAFMALASFFSENKPPPMWISVSCTILNSLSVVKVQHPSSSSSGIS